MDLRDFIRTTIVGIVNGVADASKETAELGAVINPESIRYMADGKQFRYPHAMPQEVVFDVALTATQDKGSTEGVGVFFGTVNLGKSNNAKSQQVAVTSVRFSVPLVLPQGRGFNAPGG
jgi:hypothetical protein